MGLKTEVSLEGVQDAPFITNLWPVCPLQILILTAMKETKVPASAEHENGPRRRRLSELEWGLSETVHPWHAVV